LSSKVEWKCIHKIGTKSLQNSGDADIVFEISLIILMALVIVDRT
jgi:hypothetical protein